jgi:4-hydroxybenzoate polyprenyltransferase
VIRPLLQSLRPTQWPKNVFVLAPLVFGGLLLNAQVATRAVLALVAFCCASSAIYLINDIRDREEDRRHPLKRLRPIAAGTLGVPAAIVAALVLAGAATGIAVVLGRPFGMILAAYLILNLLYTFWFKHMVILDVMWIAISFVLRVEAGSKATGIGVSSWLFLCTTFLALFLAFSKRRHEITLLADRAAGQRPVLDHYSPAFLDQMINVVTASAVVSYALYAVAPETVQKYHTQDLVYTIPLVLYGIFRYLYLMYQRPGERNPTEAILRDAPFLINILLWGLAVVWIVYGREAGLK